MLARSISATAWSRFSKSRAITIRRMWSRIKARRLASAEFCAIFSRWARVPSLIWTRSNSARSDHPRTRYLLNGVVGGIGGYGNCVGVPTVAGELMFDAGYNGNILVNAFALGIARREDLQSARADGPGNPVLYVGSATGRDGIHGASLLASAEFDAASEVKASDRSSWRSVHRKAADRSLSRSDEVRRDRRDSGYGRGRAVIVVERDGGARRSRHRPRPRPYSACARPI